MWDSMKKRCAHPELVEGSARLILQQVQDEREIRLVRDTFEFLDSG
jgi:hypothetical protein